MKILNSSVRITEMADTAKQLVMLYKSITNFLLPIQALHLWKVSL
ncbi:hypothetical protein [Capnocytophaga cynodegmi]